MFEEDSQGAGLPGDVPGGAADAGRGWLEDGYLEQPAPGVVDPVALDAYEEALVAGWIDPRDPWETYLSGPVEGVDPPTDHSDLFTDTTDDEAPGAGPSAGIGGSRVLPGVVDDMGPGPGLAGLLDDAGIAELSAYALVEAVAGWQRLASWVAAARAAALAELTRRQQMRPADGSGFRSVNPVTNTAMDIAGRLHVTARQAENLVGHAVQLVEDFPATHAALEAGVIDERRARVITGELGGQDRDIARRVEAAVLPQAPTMDSVALRRKITYLLHRLAPVETEERCRDARQERYVSVTPAEDGIGPPRGLPARRGCCRGQSNVGCGRRGREAPRHRRGAGAPHRRPAPRRRAGCVRVGVADHRPAERAPARLRLHRPARTRIRRVAVWHTRRGRIRHRPVTVRLTPGHRAGAAGHRARHHPARFPDRSGRRARRPGRIRTHPRAHRPPPRRGRHLGLGRHPPRHRAGPGLRAHPLPPHPSIDRPRHPPRPHLSRTRLPPARHPMRDRPPHPLRARSHRRL